MPVDVVSEIVIHRARTEVAAYAADPARAPEWFGSVDEIEWLSEPLLSVGAKVAFVSHATRRKLSFLFEVSEYLPDERLVMHTMEGSFPMETTYTWEDHGAGATRMTLRNRGEPTGFLRFAAPLLAPAMRRSIMKDLERLKRRLESPTR